jgi:hypothetical protein
VLLSTVRGVQLKIGSFAAESSAEVLSVASFPSLCVIDAMVRASKRVVGYYRWVVKVFVQSTLISRCSQPMGWGIMVVLLRLRVGHPHPADRQVGRHPLLAFGCRWGLPRGGPCRPSAQIPLAFPPSAPRKDAPAFHSLACRGLGWIHLGDVAFAASRRALK